MGFLDWVLTVYEILKRFIICGFKWLNIVFLMVEYIIFDGRIYYF